MQKIIQDQYRFFTEQHTKTYAFRVEQLMNLKKGIIKYQTEIQDALKKDLNKSEFEAYATEIGYVLSSITKTIKSLKSWMRIKKVKTPMTQPLSKSYIQPEPLGNVLIIGPYNYPFQLVIEPLIGALAAGNTAVVKPSEYASHTEAIIKKMIEDTFDSALVAVVTGGVDVTKALLEMRFDHIFFTGSTRVGKIVYQAAAKNLTPVTLELGGKSPTIVDETANIKLAAKRIAFGKFMNAGQTCIAPDYVYVQESVKDDLIEALKDTIKVFFLSDLSQYGRIINDKHMERLMSYLNPEKIVFGGETDIKTKYIAPTLMTDIEESDVVMQEEIFGPILPILAYQNIDTLLSLLQKKEKPLALYLFSNNKQTQKKIWSKLSFGGGAINDTIMHVANEHLPFGGVGASGLGAYHGKTSFDTFSHHKAYMKKSHRFDLPFLYPPYSKKQLSLIKKVLK